MHSYFENSRSRIKPYLKENETFPEASVVPENDFVVLPLASVIVIDTEAPPTGLFVLASVTVTMTVCVLRVIVSLANDIERASCLLPPPEPPSL